MVHQKMKSPNKIFKENSDVTSQYHTSERQTGVGGGRKVNKNSAIATQISLLFAKCCHASLKQQMALKTGSTLCVIVCIV